MATPLATLARNLVAGHNDGDGQTNFVADSLAQPGGDVGWFARYPTQPRDVEKGLVDRETFHQGRGVTEDLEHVSAGGGVGLHAGGHEHGFGTQSAGFRPAHGGTHAVASGLIARRQHDSPSDDHGTAAEVGCIPLLDRRVEGIEVGVEDGCPHRTHVRISAHAVHPSSADYPAEA